MTRAVALLLAVAVLAVASACGEIVTPRPLSDFTPEEIARHDVKHHTRAGLRSHSCGFHHVLGQPREHFLPEEHPHVVERGTALECPGFLPGTECDLPATRDATPLTPTNVRMMIHVPRRGDGSNPALSEVGIAREIENLQNSFADSGIEFDVQVRYIDDTRIRNSPVLTGGDGKTSCSLARIGNGACDSACAAPSVGYDGGDCEDFLTDQSVLNQCNPDNIGNGACDPTCNFARHQWDGGDCCVISNSRANCLDPNSPNRRYLFEISSFKAALNTPYASQAINVYVPELLVPQNLLGRATFPVETRALTTQGGFIARASAVGTVGAPTVPHEIGHCFGLWHVFTGVSEVADCNNQCFENVNSDGDQVGDLCSDTAPAPRHFDCPAGDNIEIEEGIPATDCEGVPWADIPKDNIMSYTDCSNQVFTPQQLRRMRCYADSLLQSWIGTWADIGVQDAPTSEIPVAPPREPTVTGSGDAPAEWLCDPSYYNTDDGCDCSCGAYDPDCDRAPPVDNDVSSPYIFGCNEGRGASCSPEGTCVYEVEVPAAWSCSLEYYASNDGCDCECGAPDPDCDTQGDLLFNCGDDAGATCVNGECQFTIPAGWTCNTAFYGTLDGCDCECGAVDPDCNDPVQRLFTYNCEFEEECSPSNVCVDGPAHPRYQRVSVVPVSGQSLATCNSLLPAEICSSDSDGLVVLDDCTSLELQDLVPFGSFSGNTLQLYVNSDVSCSGTFVRGSSVSIECSNNCNFEFSSGQVSVPMQMTAMTVPQAMTAMTVPQAMSVPISAPDDDDGSSATVLHASLFALVAAAVAYLI